ncbi:MAG: 50S ribosomal protein L15 [Pontimonas sp.]
MAEEKKPAAKKPAAKPAAKKETAAKKPAAKTSAAKAPAKKPATAAKPAAKAAAKPAAKKTTTAKAPAKKPAAAKAPAKTTAAKAPAAKAPAAKKPAATKSAAPKKETTAKAAAPAKKAPAKKPVSESESRPGVVKLHHQRPAAGAKKAKTRVGRGEASKGKTAGRGTKGTKARYQVRPGFQGGQLTSVMRAPKLRGFTNPFRVEYQVVNVGRLGELYPKGGDVTVTDLVAKGAVRKNQKVKVLADGELSVALTVSVDKVSKQAAEKIVKAGGSIKE